MSALAGSVISMYLSGFKKSLWWEKVCFIEKRNKGKVGQDRSGRGREFQMDGAANEKERRPFADRILGTVRKNLFKIKIHTADAVQCAFAKWSPTFLLINYQECSDFFSRKIPSEMAF